MAIKTVFSRTYLYLLIVIIGVMVCFGVFIYKNTAQTMKMQLGNKCIGIATAVSVMMEDDIDDYIAFAENLDTQSDYYQAIYSKLNRIRYENADNIAFLYVEKRISDTMIMYILDGENKDDPLFSLPGDVDMMSDTELEAYRTQVPTISNDFITNDYGTLLTCYVPLHNPSTGEFLGLVGVDVSIDQYNAVMRNQLITIVVSITLLILLVLLTLLLSSGWIEKIIARDNLTGAYNKTYFMRGLRQQLKYSKHKGRPITVFMADLDHFKRINDTYGHVFGDVVLSSVSDTISKLLRKMDCFSRYGGEEFAAYLPDIGIEDGENVVERIRLAVENMKIFNPEYNEYIHITISIGVAQFEPHNSAQDIIDLADKAMYQAKRTRNSIAVYLQNAPE